ncbi:hypothetical protein A3C23_00235 [Candidatus Roizmanbacteria bacterium RIFCSPHIGHO2_02_FULL_37_13b]|uniref:Uncharacterized protein n=1 Tax=Candidatus Roizmanbacteria bacterium RIFCSPLOWO2_02_FULL_36_11 TaxID=1802071 RepID=A0A1F7JHR2_9BACT|nr:MAG: hypothetical protein A3C23_00235 [Candidatus Roizmanbacteria bacterium RIFCSPHIGHO2_02_FULL_37_13b]OGK55127.1 MAG: hypothetical protein A3H78_04045 [Candidatus Roizmanbacteria bacterium RIFCSPLOWO2_02_FULL_36_11]
MTKLEDNIIKKIYRFETKRSLSFLLIRISAIIVGLILIWISFSKSWQQVIEWQVMDLLSYLNYDLIPFIDRVKMMLIGFYLESPKEAMIFFLIWFFIVSIIVSGLIKNRKKIFNCFRCLFVYWTKKC